MRLLPPPGPAARPVATRRARRPVRPLGPPPPPLGLPLGPLLTPPAAASAAAAAGPASLTTPAAAAAAAEGVGLVTLLVAVDLARG